MTPLECLNNSLSHAEAATLPGFAHTSTPPLERGDRARGRESNTRVTRVIVGDKDKGVLAIHRKEEGIGSLEKKKNKYR